MGESTKSRAEAYRAIEEATVAPESRDLCVNTFDGEDATGAEIVETLFTVPFMGGTRLVHVKRFDRMAPDEQNIIAEACEKGLSGSVLVLSAQSVDGRRKAIQTLMKTAEKIECSPPEGGALINWVMSQAEERELAMARDAAVVLVGQVGERTDQLLSELDKLADYLGPGATVRADDVATVVSVLAPEAAEYEIFELCDAVAEGRLQAVLLGLDKLFASDANPIYIVIMLARHYRTLLAICTHGSKSPGLLKKDLNLRQPIFVIERLMRQATTLGRASIEDGLRLLLKTDMQLKRSALGRSTVESTAIRLATMGSA